MIASRNLETSSTIPRTISKLPEYDLESVRRRIMDTDCQKQAQNSATVTHDEYEDSHDGQENGIHLSNIFDDDDQYESLPSSTMGTHMVAGGIAGVMEHCVMYPVDSVKVSS